MRLRITGHSYNEISAKLGTPKSTLRTWLGNLVLSDNAKARLLARVKQGTINSFVKRNKLQTHYAEHRAKVERSNGKKQISQLGISELKILGAALYWAEGYKRLKVKNGKERMGHTISFVNADADMVHLFLKFLKDVLQIPDNKIRLSMRLYEHINEQVTLAYWMRATGFPKDNFHKTTYLVSLASKRRKPYNRLPYGTLQVEVCDTARFHYLMGLIDGVKRQF